MAITPRSRVAGTAGLAVLLAALALPLAAPGQEKPYFVTYDHHLEEPGSLEISVSPVWGAPKTTSNFVSSSLEIGYGVQGWWTTEFYLDGQSTRRDSTLFTGYRWENRLDRKSTRLNSSHIQKSRMPSSA